MSTHQKLVWVAALYFAEGFPFGLVMDAIPVYLRLQGVSLADIGLLGLVGLPWTLKFLWAPVVDRLPLPFLTRRLGRRRAWMLLAQLVIIAGLYAISQQQIEQDLMRIVALALVVALPLLGSTPPNTHASR